MLSCDVAQLRLISRHVVTDPTNNFLYQLIVRSVAKYKGLLTGGWGYRKKVVPAAPQGACEHTATPDQFPIRMFCENDFGKETP